MSVGRVTKAQLMGFSGNVSEINDAKRQLVESEGRKHYYPLGKIRVGPLKIISLDNAPCSKVQIRNPEGNGIVYVGGASGSYQATLGIMQPIYETELVEFEVQNANELTLIADNLNTDVIVSVLSDYDLNVTVSNPPPPDNTPPTISSTSPVNGATVVQINAAISILFSEELDSSTITNTNITVSPAISYTVAKDSTNPNKVLIIPSTNLALSTVYTITSKVGLRDIAGNPLPSQSSFSFTTSSAPPGVDITPPTVASTNPANNATSIVLSISPTISFSEAMLSSTITTANFKVFADANNQAVTVANTTLSADGKTVTLTLGNLLNGTKYRIEVGTGVKDLAGNAMAAKYTTFFTTVAQQTNTIYQLTTNGYYQLYSGNYTEIREVCNSIHSYMYNKKILTYSFDAYKGGLPSGNITINIYNASGTLVHTFTETLSATSLTTSTKQYTLNSPGNTVVMNVGYSIGIKFNSGDGSNYVMVGYASGTGYNSSDSFLRAIIIGFSLDYTDSDLSGIMLAA